MPAVSRLDRRPAAALGSFRHVRSLLMTGLVLHRTVLALAGECRKNPVFYSTARPPADYPGPAPAGSEVARIDRTVAPAQMPAEELPAAPAPLAAEPVADLTAPLAEAVPPAGEVTRLAANTDVEATA